MAGNKKHAYKNAAALIELPSYNNNGADGGPKLNSSVKTMKQITINQMAAAERS